jgi:Protein of unknown function (DUF2442)
VKKHHEISRVAVRQGRLALTVDGRRLVFPLRAVSRRLAAAKPGEASAFEISPSGYGIRWPLLDEDISIDGLLKIKHAPKTEPALA